MSLIEKARKHLKGNAFGESTQSISKAIDEDPRCVANSLNRHEDFVCLGGRRGRKTFILREKLTETQMEAWVE